ncbi:MAG: isoprenylcysteine carboxylmethyltransferase family protein [Neisseriaceae bacterium]|jgi:protein-S-isoprenylcysteine O-methyltransferase Ste14|nr:hypothetical protein [Pseudomonadota bacterium]RTL01067.1 MAG: isoprenylcysteine carboxylmethyltransferase family protein [Neisseriaceae bacterium]
MWHALETRIPPPLLMLLCAAIMSGIDQLWPQQWLSQPIAGGMGLLLAGCGAMLDLGGLLHFLRARTTINPLKPASSRVLVTNGIYRVSRNPMYAGMLLMLGGWAAYLANPLALAGLPLFVASVTRLQIVPEERILLRLFGQTYADYCRQVRRWL